MDDHTSGPAGEQGHATGEGDEQCDEGHGHGHGHGQGHGHAEDRGVRALLRYLRWAPRMWRSSVNDAVIDLVAPASGERVVDIGAGMGPGTVRAAERGASVVSVDPTPYMRRILSLRKLAQRSRSRISVVDGSAEQIPVADDTIDAAWAVNTMHHWTDIDAATAELVRVLRPGGRVVLVDEDFDDPQHPDHERFTSHQGDEDHHGFSMIDADEFGQRLVTAGLVEVTAEKRQLAERPVIAITGRAPTAHRTG